jgi:hypothetical protein
LMVLASMQASQALDKDCVGRGKCS